MARQYADLEAEVSEAINRVCRDAAFIKGPVLEEFEGRFSGLHGVRHAIGVASGTDALRIAVQALDIGSTFSVSPTSASC